MSVILAGPRRFPERWLSRIESRMWDSLMRLHNRFVQAESVEGGTRPLPSDIPNFRKISNNLFFGGQPTARGFSWLASQGVKTVVTFRSENPADSEWKLFPAARHHEILISDRQIPTFAQVEAFLKICEAEENQPVFAHCRGGTGRARLMAACWQVAHGRTAEAAIQEAREAGIRYSLDLRINLSFTISFSMNAEQQLFLRRFEQCWREEKARKDPRLHVHSNFTHTRFCEDCTKFPLQSSG